LEIALRFSKTPIRMGIAWTYEEWDKLVTKYTSCELTVSSDKLVAVSGLAKRFARQMKLDPTDYAAGLWKTNFPRGLLWSLKDQTHNKGNRVAGRGPSWSWACVDGEVEFYEGYFGEVAHNRVLDVCVLHEDNLFGKLRGGRIRLQGPLLAMDIEKQNRDDITFSFMNCTIDRPPGIMNPLVHSRREIAWDYITSSRTPETEPVFFLLLVSWDLEFVDTMRGCGGLVLAPTGQQPGEFRRLGMLLKEFLDIDAPIQNAKDPDSSQPWTSRQVRKMDL
jgi:hypothetical protein